SCEGDSGQPKPTESVLVLDQVDQYIRLEPCRSSNVLVARGERKKLPGLTVRAFRTAREALPQIDSPPLQQTLRNFSARLCSNRKEDHSVRRDECILRLAFAPTPAAAGALQAAQGFNSRL